MYHMLRCPSMGSFCLQGDKQSHLVGRYISWHSKSTVFSTFKRLQHHRLWENSIGHCLLISFPRNSLLLTSKTICLTHPVGGLREIFCKYFLLQAAPLSHGKNLHDSQPGSGTQAGQWATVGLCRKFWWWRMTVCPTAAHTELSWRQIMYCPPEEYENVFQNVPNTPTFENNQLEKYPIGKEIKIRFTRTKFLKLRQSEAWIKKNIFKAISVSNGWLSERL